jgi:hypothetical protein
VKQARHEALYANANTQMNTQYFNQFDS